MIVYDLQALQSRAHADRGIARYTFELARAIVRLSHDRIDAFTINPSLAVPSSIYEFAEHHQIVRSDQLRGKPISLLHIASPMELDRPIEQMLIGRPDRLVVNLYDLIPAIFPERYLSNLGSRAHYWSRLGLYSVADEILSDSQSSVDDAVRILGVSPARCTVIGAGAGPQFVPWDGAGVAPIRVAQAAVDSLSPGFILAPSGMDWRKNYEGVLEAYSLLSEPVRRAHQMVLMCKVNASQRRELEALCSRLGIEGSVLVTGYVADSVLVALQQAASLVVFPSFYEGFGLPVLEARRCGAPVICGDNSALREILPAFARFDAGKVEAISAAMERALVDGAFRDSLLSAELPDFTWERAAELTVAVYDRALSHASSSRTSSARIHLAYVAPLPPVESGVADYTSRLLAAVAKRVPVTCFVDQPTDRITPPSGVLVRPLRDLVALYDAGYFSNVVVALGNNQLHRSALELLHKVPCVAHLHDVRLVNCYAESTWPAIVAQHYPGRYFDFQLLSFDGPSAPAVHEQGVLMLHDVVANASAILVHSSFAATMVGLDTGATADNIGPLASPSIRDLPPSNEDAPKLVASFGFVHPLKQSGKVIEAAELLIGDPSVTVALVGPSPHRPSLDPGERIVHTGRVSDEEFESWMDKTIVAVQLRDSSNGESSSVIADCLARGIPTIVTDLGSISEMPDEVVVKVAREISATELAMTIRSLLDDPARRKDIGAAARRYASGNSFDDAADRLLGAIGIERTTSFG